MNMFFSRAMAVTAGLGFTFAAQADGLDTLGYALSGGTPNVDFRLRYESVELEPVYGAGVTEDEATAATARIRLGYTTGKWNNIDLQAELENVSNIGGEHFQSSRNKQATYPAILDPEGGELNQAWIRYSGLPKTAVKIGRQKVIYDNARYIGNVGWRQNEQTYDGATLASTFLPKTTVNVAYLTSVNSFRSFRMDPANAGAPCNAAFACSDDLDLKAQLVNIAVTPLKTPTLLTLTPYLYRLDFEFNSAARRDTQTLGLRASGVLPYQQIKFSYTLEYADQQDYADKPSPTAADVDAKYRLIEAGASYAAFSAKLGYEVLGSNNAGTYGFQTPLATIHAHDGWADLFVATPATGLERLYLQAGYSWKKLALTGVYHRFSASKGGDDYGTEIDFQAVYQITDQFTFGAKLARFSGDYDGTAAALASLKSDTNKNWAWIEYKF